MSNKETYENKLIRMRKLLNAILTGNHKEYDYITMRKLRAFSELMMTQSIKEYIRINNVENASYIEFLTPFKKVVELAKTEAAEGNEDAEGIFDDLVSRISVDGKRPTFQPTTLGPTELLDAIYEEIKRRKGVGM